MAQRSSTGLPETGSTAYQPPWPQTKIPHLCCSTARCCAARQHRARREPVTFLLDRVTEDMEERVQAVTRNFSIAADIWTPGRDFRAHCAIASAPITRIDLDESELLPLQPESLDLALSALAFQFVNDLPGVLAQIRRALKPDGLLLAAMVGGDSLTELRQSFAAAEAECEGGVSPRVAPFADLRDIGACCNAPALRCRSPTSTASWCATTMPLR